MDLQEPFAYILPSECTVGVLSRLRCDYNIPDDIELFLTTVDYDAYIHFSSHRPIHVMAFESGVHLPLHPTFRRAFCAFELAPMQLVRGSGET